jgi:hypothetical protein
MMGGMPSDRDKEVFDELCDAFVGRATSQAENEVGAAFNPRLQHSRTLVEAGEGAIGLEDLASNLYEFQIPLSAEQAEVIAQLATAWGIARDRWSFIEELVP